MAALFWKYRLLFLIIIIIALTYLGPQAIKVKPDNSVEAMGLTDDPQLKLVQEIEQNFGSEEYITISFKAKDIFDSSSLQVIQKLTKFLDNLNLIENVNSLTTIWKIDSNNHDGDKELAITSYLKKEWIQNGVPKKARKGLLSHPIYKGLVYNKEGTATSIIAQLVPLGNQELKRSQVIHQIRDFVAKLKDQTGIQFHIFGFPIMNRSIYETVEKEQNILTPLMILAIFLLIFLLYRNFYLSIASVLMLLVVFTIVMGVLGLFGINLNWLTSMAPAVIMIVSICDSMHIINEFKRTSIHMSRAERVKQIFKSVGPPCLLTSLTTGVGFLSLAAGRIKPLREFGIYITLGIVIAMLLSFTLLIILLNYGPKSLFRENRKKPNQFITWILEGAYNLVITRPKTIVVMSILFTVLSAIGIIQLEFNQKSLDLYKQDPYQLVAANEFVKQGIAGGIETQAYIKTETPGIFYEPKYLKMVEDYEHRALTEVSSINKAITIVDLIKYANQMMNSNDPTYYRIPKSREKIAQLFLILEMQADQIGLRQLVLPDYSTTLMRIYTRVNADVEQSLKNFDVANYHIPLAFTETLKPIVTSKSLIATHTIRYLPRTMALSLSISILLITILIMYLFRSIKIGLISIIPNVIPIFFCMGIMGLLGIWLNIATSMVFAVAIGIAVDDSIHLMWNMRKNIRSGLEDKQALKRTFEEIGVPVTISTFVLAGGFLMLCFSQLWPTTQFGIFVALCCLLALIADLLLTPVILIKFKPFCVKNKSLEPTKDQASLIPSLH